MLISRPGAAGASWTQATPAHDGRGGRRDETLAPAAAEAASGKARPGREAANRSLHVIDEPVSQRYAATAQVALPSGERPEVLMVRGGNLAAGHKGCGAGAGDTH